MKMEEDLADMQRSPQLSPVTDGVLTWMILQTAGTPLGGSRRHLQEDLTDSQETPPLLRGRRLEQLHRPLVRMKQALVDHVLGIGRRKAVTRVLYVSIATCATQRLLSFESRRD